MKTTAIRRWMALLLTLTLSLSLASPALAADPEPSPDPPSGANTEISVRDEVQLNPGDSMLVTAAVTGNNDRTRITWTSADKSVVETEYNTDSLADHHRHGQRNRPDQGQYRHRAGKRQRVLGAGRGL